ncbi:MAG TPA: class I SAM-dependent methyltransferase [Rhodanobacteraceae bacterium]|nr:class I SAM-dependent methyltransferase [Rhodanobacteraceae bacterium]
MSACVDPYANYTQWKQWDGAFAPADREARYFAAEFRDIPLRDKRVLEIGFGNGSFLAWAKGEGARVAGIEINPEMREAARAHGFETFEIPLTELAALDARYDLVVAFDVLEHWDTDELVANFRAIRALLAPGGLFVSRFPNGQSPFGRVFQHGDFSHQSILSTYKIEYLAGVAGFEIVRIDNPCRVPSKPGPLASVRHWWMARRRRWIERSIARLYGIRKLPLDPNLVAVLKKPGAAESTQRNPA